MERDHPCFRITEDAAHRRFRAQAREAIRSRRDDTERRVTEKILRAPDIGRIMDRQQRGRGVPEAVRIDSDAYALGIELMDHASSSSDENSAVRD